MNDDPGAVVVQTVVNDFPVVVQKLEECIDRRMFFDYTPTQDALEINR